MAMELMNADPKQDVSHQVHHDLESFFWLLVWFVLHHTNHDHKEGKGTFAKVFGANVPEDARERKENMLLRKFFTIKGNTPLSYLLQRLQSMVSDAYILNVPKFGNVTQTLVPLTYDAMLEAFDEALGMKGWPEDDAAIPFKPPYSETDGGMNIKRGADAGIIGTSSRLRKERVESALSAGDGSAPSLPSEPQGSQDAESTPTRPKRGTGRDGQAKSTRSQASGRGTKRKQPSRTRSSAQQTNVGTESSSTAAGLLTTHPGSAAAGWHSAEPPCKKCRAKDWSELLPPREMHERKAKWVRRG
ncbi:hypothetical protein WOLCODRAFT_159517 [Wolfiporia cocos MD-104 SS10]|uniref:Fungal-type protein kinase domain-containing protein n=1 Tax=Wolfiporia cocos (strain MD-104) TaxID=742152 RepID=A0A2H3J476_WOLCO|nr:hypothetical protein WOLCODRAFT_159517 [Wolfiporia cocos MD-104 SS10]